MDKIVVASGNKGKLREIAQILDKNEIVGYKEYLDIEIEENGNSFYENALIKAKTVSEALGLPALSDDSGICVEALDGAPGIYSARYAGDGDDEHNNQKLLKELQGKKNRNAKFVSCVVMYYPDGTIISALGETEGVILEKAEGEHGFGYDPIFFSKDLNKSFGIATEEEKNSVSHRARALWALKAKLK